MWMWIKQHFDQMSLSMQSKPNQMGLTMQSKPNQMGLAEAVVESVSACELAAQPWLYRFFLKTNHSTFKVISFFGDCFFHN